MWQDLKNIYHLFVAFLANVLYGFPSRKLIVIGVTGTDGKTTTVNAIFHILQSAGLDVSMISTTGAVINGKDYDVGFHVTTPSSWAIQRFLKHAIVRGPVKSFFPATAPAKSCRQAGANAVRGVGNPSTFATPKKYMVLELTSHALHQYRDWGIKYDVGVLTNITNEHLDYHKTYENYVKAKTKLLLKSKLSIINKDDRSYDYVISKLKSQNSNLQLKTKKLITYGLKNKADFIEKDLPSGLELAEFNRYNLLAAIATCKSLGINDEDIKKGAKSFEPPIGRLQTVYHKDFDVMIDFAHTPNAFEQLFLSIKSSVKGRIIHIFGCAGQRDFKKRPEMGRVSAANSDIIILTAEDPRTESFERINQQIKSGMENLESKISKGAILEILDRQEAISKAISLAKKGDLVLLTGKAHEKSMNYGKGEIAWSEHESVKNALKINGLR